MDQKLPDGVEVIKETDPRFTFEKPTRKTVLLCTNGFQNADIHDSTNLREYYGNNFAADFPNCEIAPVQLFLPADPKTHHAKHMEAALNQMIVDYIDKGYDIILLGYSYSAALVAKMAYRYQKYIQKIILVAPIYDTVLNGMIHGYITYSMKYTYLVHKYGAKIAKAMGRTTTKGMFSLLLSIYRSILQNRPYFRKVSCPVLLLWGAKDVLCTRHSLKKVRQKLAGPQILYTYMNLNHTLFKSIKEDGDVYEDILHYSFDTPFLLNSKSLSVAKPSFKPAIKLDEDGEPIPTFSQIFSGLDPEAEKESAKDNDAA